MFMSMSMEDVFAVMLFHIFFSSFHALLVESIYRHVLYVQR